MNSSFRRSLAACLALPVSVLLLSGCSGKTEDVRIVLCKEVTDRLLADLHPVYWAGWLVICGLVVWEQKLGRVDDLSRAGVAFFNMNGVISVVYLVSVLLAVLLPRAG